MDIDKLKELIEKNHNYWQNRALNNKLNVLENEEDYLNRLKGIYDRATKDIDDKVAQVYARYAKNNKITTEEAYKILPKKIETDYKDDLQDYINKAQSGNPKYRKYLLNQSLMRKHTVLDQLRTSLRKTIYEIDMENTQGKFLEKIYTVSNYKAQYDADCQQKLDAFVLIDNNKIQSLLNENWSGGGSFSQLIWKNQDLLVKALDDILVKGFAVGDSYETMAKKLAKRMDTSKSNAMRLVRTEAARMATQGTIQQYRDLGVNKVINIATLDDRTSDICMSIDGLIVELDKVEIGLNAPPYHPYCRTVLSPYFEDNEPETRIYRPGGNGKSTKGKYRTFDQFLEDELGDKEKAKAIRSTRNDLQTLLNAVGYSPITKTVIKNEEVSIEPNNDLLNKNEEEYLEFKNSNPEYTEESEEKVLEEIKDILENNDFAIRSTMESLQNILEDGRFKSQFETKKSGGLLNEKERKSTENKLFGYKEDLPNKLRPIYGYLTNFKDGFDGSKNNCCVMYGNVAIKLKKNNLKNRTSFVFGDSLDSSRWDYKVPSLYTNPSMSTLCARRMLTDNSGKYTGKLGKNMKEVTTNINYVELQYHKGVKVNDIEKVYIYKSYETYLGKKKFNMDSSTLRKLTKKLDELDIDYEVVE